MAYSQHRASLEAQLARAHRALAGARAAAEMLNEEGTIDDLYQIEREVIRVHEASLKNKPSKKPIPGQTSIPA